MCCLRFACEMQRLIYVCGVRCRSDAAVPQTCLLYTSQKQADLGALVEKIKGAQSGVLVDYTGITVEQDTKLLSLIHI